MQPTTIDRRPGPSGLLAGEVADRAAELDRQALVRLHLLVQCEIWRARSAGDRAAEIDCLEPLLARLTARLAQALAGGVRRSPLDPTRSTPAPAPDPVLV